MISPTLQSQIAEEAGHLAAVPGSEWSFWRWVCLRGAGFPSNGVLRLAATPETIVAAEQAAQAAEALELARANALQHLRAALDELRSTGQWENKQRRKPLLDAISKINAGKLPRSMPEGVSPCILESINAAETLVEARAAAFQREFAQSWRETGDAIREIAGSDAFREALTWQNRTAVGTALDSLLREPRAGQERDSARRQHEELVAGYWQRYCVKNDTIGFFGPVGWARLTPDDCHMKIGHGAQLLATRKTYWESWAIEALGAILTRRHNLQPWIAPILVPFIRIEDTSLSHPLFGNLPLTAAQAAMLRACNGRDTAKQITTRLMRMAKPPVRDPAEVYEGFRDLAARGFLVARRRQTLNIRANAGRIHSKPVSFHKLPRDVAKGAESRLSGSEHE